MSHVAGTYADSEYGLLTEALICPPCAPSDAFAQLPEMKTFDAAQALSQHSALAGILRSEGVACRYLRPSPTLPYQCFTRDSSVVTPWGLLLTKMSYGPRKEETVLLKEFAQATGLTIWRELEAGTLEGGDIVFLRPGIVLIGCNQDRTTEHAASLVKTWFEAEGWVAKIVRYPSGFVHLDVIMNVLDASTALYCEQTLAREDLDWIERIGVKLYPVPTAQSGNMVCNSLSIGERRIISCTQNVYGNALMTELGYRVIGLEIDQFLGCNGGIHCLVSPLVRRPSSTCQ